MVLDLELAPWEGPDLEADLQRKSDLEFRLWRRSALELDL